MYFDISLLYETSMEKNLLNLMNRQTNKLFLVLSAYYCNFYPVFIELDVKHALDYYFIEIIWDEDQTNSITMRLLRNVIIFVFIFSFYFVFYNYLVSIWILYVFMAFVKYFDITIFYQSTVNFSILKNILFWKCIKYIYKYM